AWRGQCAVAHIGSHDCQVQLVGRVCRDVAGRVAAELAILVRLVALDADGVVREAVDEPGNLVGTGDALSGSRIDLDDEVLVATGGQAAWALEGDVDTAVRGDRGHGELVLIAGGAALRADAEGGRAGDRHGVRPGLAAVVRHGVEDGRADVAALA